MAYATDNPIKKVAQMGGNSLWYYADGDATSTIVGSGYFNSAAFSTEFRPKAQK